MGGGGAAPARFGEEIAVRRPEWSPWSLVLVVVAGLGMLAAAAGIAAGQEGTPVPLEPPLDRMQAAWAARDPAAIAALYAEDAVLTEAVVDGPVLRGRDAIRQWAEANFAGFPDLMLEPRSALATPDRAVIEWTYVGTYTGQIPGLPAGTGAAISIPGVSVMDLDPESGLIVRDTMYYDRATFERQFMAGFGGAPATPAP